MVISHWQGTQYPLTREHTEKHNALTFPCTHRLLIGAWNKNGARNLAVSDLIADPDEIAKLAGLFSQHTHKYTVKGNAHTFTHFCYLNIHTVAQAQAVGVRKSLLHPVSVPPLSVPSASVPLPSSSTTTKPLTALPATLKQTHSLSLTPLHILTQMGMHA